MTKRKGATRCHAASANEADALAGAKSNDDYVTHFETDEEPTELPASNPAEDQDGGP